MNQDFEAGTGYWWPRIAITFVALAALLTFLLSTRLVVPAGMRWAFRRRPAPARASIAAARHGSRQRRRSGDRDRRGRAMTDRAVAGPAVARRLGTETLGRLRSLRRRLWWQGGARRCGHAATALCMALVQLLSRAFPFELAPSSNSPWQASRAWRGSS